MNFRKRINTISVDFILARCTSLVQPLVSFATNTSVRLVRTCTSYGKHHKQNSVILELFLDPLSLTSTRELFPRQTEHKQFVLKKMQRKQMNTICTKPNDRVGTQRDYKVSR